MFYNEISLNYTTHLMYIPILYFIDIGPQPSDRRYVPTRLECYCGEEEWVSIHINDLCLSTLRPPCVWGCYTADGHEGAGWHAVGILW